MTDRQDDSGFNEWWARVGDEFYSGGMTGFDIAEAAWKAALSPQGSEPAGVGAGVQTITAVSGDSITLRRDSGWDEQHVVWKPRKLATPAPAQQAVTEQDGAQGGEADVWAVYHDKEGQRSWDYIGDETAARVKADRCNMQIGKFGAPPRYVAVALYTRPAIAPQACEPGDEGFRAAWQAAVQTLHDVVPPNWWMDMPEGSSGTEQVQYAIRKLAIPQATPAADFWNAERLCAATYGGEVWCVMHPDEKRAARERLTAALAAPPAEGGHADPA